MKKIYWKFVLDVILGIIFALLFNHRILGGLSFHETAGLAVGFAVIFHILLNFRWIKNTTRSIFSKKLNARTRIGYFLNLLLLADLVIIIISGIFISKVLFPAFPLQSNFFNPSTHIAASYLILALIGIHLGLHWRWVMNLFKKIFRIKKVGNVAKYAIRIMAALVFAIGLYYAASVSYFQTVAQMVGAGSSALYESSQSLEHEDEGDGNHSGNYYSDSGGADRNSSGRAQRGSGGLAGGSSANPAGVLVKYFSMISVFSVPVYYTEKILLLKKSKKLPKAMIEKEI